MVIKNILYKSSLYIFFSLLVFCAGCYDARAETDNKSLHFVGLYQFDWGGILLGKLVLGIDEDQHSYQMHLQVASAGIVNLFTRHSDDTKADGRREGDKYFPFHYESYYKTKNKPRHIKLAFNKSGVVTEEINEPPEDRNDRPEVPHKFKDGSYDPLTGLMVLRSGVEDLRAFDAKRMYQVRAIKNGVDTLWAGGKWYPAASYILKRFPLAGLTQKELGEYKKGEPPLTFYFSNDARHIPLGIAMPIFLGSVKGVLVKECKKWEECEIK